jgi:hypothetical protein
MNPDSKSGAKIAGGPEAGAFVRIHPTCEAGPVPEAFASGAVLVTTIKPDFQLSVA